MTWDTVDAVFALVLIALAAGALACVRVIARSYGTERMSAQWLARLHHERQKASDWREA